MHDDQDLRGAVDEKKGLLAEARKENRDQAVQCCPEGHTLAVKRTLVPGYTCNRCKQTLAEGTTVGSCRQCDFDVCKKCRQPAKRQGKDHKPLSSRAIRWCRSTKNQQRMAIKLLFALPAMLVVVAGLVTAVVSLVALESTAEDLAETLRKQSMNEIISSFPDAVAPFVLGASIHHSRITSNTLGMEFAKQEVTDQHLRYLWSQIDSLNYTVQFAIAVSAQNNTILAAGQRRGEKQLAWVKPSANITLVHTARPEGGDAVVISNVSYDVTQQNWAMAPGRWKEGQMNWTETLVLLNALPGLGMVKKLPGEPYVGVCVSFMTIDYLATFLRSRLPTSKSFLLLMEAPFEQFSSPTIAPLHRTAAEMLCKGLGKAQCGGTRGCRWGREGNDDTDDAETCMPDSSGLLIATSQTQQTTFSPDNTQRFVHESPDPFVKAVGNHIRNSGGYRHLALAIEDAASNQASGHVVGEMRHGGETYYTDSFAIREEHGLRWVCVLVTPQWELFKATDTQREGVVTVAIICIACGFVVSITASLMVQRPMQRVKVELERRGVVNQRRYLHLSLSLMQQAKEVPITRY